MDIFCLKSGIGQSDEERNAHLEKLLDSVVPSSMTEGDGVPDETAEQGKYLRQALDLLASGSIESICFRSPDVLAGSEEESAKLKSFLSENEIGLTVAVADIGSSPAGSGVERGGVPTPMTLTRSNPHEDG